MHRQSHKKEPLKAQQLVLLLLTFSCVAYPPSIFASSLPFQGLLAVDEVGFHDLICLMMLMMMMMMMYYFDWFSLIFSRLVLIPKLPFFSSYFWSHMHCTVTVNKTSDDQKLKKPHLIQRLLIGERKSKGKKANLWASRTASPKRGFRSTTISTSFNLISLAFCWWNSIWVWWFLHYLIKIKPLDHFYKANNHIF